MVDIKQYVYNCADDKKELLLVWYFAGGSTCNNDTVFYKSNTLYLIQEFESKFNNYLFYCENDYIGEIDWKVINALDEANQTSIVKGLTALSFVFFYDQQNPETFKLDTSLLPEYLNEVKENKLKSPPEIYTPFSKYYVDTSRDILIDDDQYYQIMQILGQPFIRDRELEYNRQAILKLAIEPALRMYYTYFPLLQEQVLPSNPRQDYLIPYPTVPYEAYKAIAYVTGGGGSGGGGMASAAMFGAMNGTVNPLTAQAFMMAGTSVGTGGNVGTAGFGAVGFSQRGSRAAGKGYKFQQPIQYDYPVPGFTGKENVEQEKGNSLADTMIMANTMKNMMRREKLSKIHIPGKGLFAKGYSTMSGYLNIKWLCWSRDFNDVEFEDWYKVIQLCQAYVKVSIGAIRGLLRTDSNIPFKEGIDKEGAEEIKNIEKDWQENPARLMFTPARGGML